MLIAAIAILAALGLLLLFVPTRRHRKPNEPFDWSHRRPWWRPRSIFPDDR